MAVVGSTVDSFIPEYPNQTNPALQAILKGRQEFRETEARVGEKKPEVGNLFAHQVLFRRLVRIYHRILLISEPGTGKTISFLSAVERLRQTGMYRGAYVIEKGEAAIDDALRQFKRQMPPKDLLRTTEEVSMLTFKRRVSNFYTFTTYGKFTKDVAKMSDEEVARNFAGFIIVCDEIHNITYNTKSDRYKAFIRIADLAPRAAIILATATPMVNAREESIALMNIVLPKHRRFSADFDFDAPGAMEEFTKRCLNYTSYVSAESTRVNLIEEGAPIEAEGDVVPPSAFVSKMGDIQAKVYVKYAPDIDDESVPDDLDEEGSSQTNAVYNQSIQASMFVFPDGSIGGSLTGEEEDGEGLNRYAEPIPGDSTEGQRWFRFKPSARVEGVPFGKWIAARGTANLARLSGKFAAAIQTEIDEYEVPGTSFVYSEAKNGGGAILFAMCLEAFGYERYVPSMGRSKKKRFAIITPETARGTREAILEAFRSEENVRGDVIKIVVGSRFARDSLNLFHARRIHLLLPSWTEAGALQAKMRAIRADSHNMIAAALGKEVIDVKLYRHAAITEDETSIDLYILRVAFDKDLLIRGVLRQLKRAAIDCRLNLFRNVNAKTSKDYSADCDYKRCAYTCAGKEPSRSDEAYTVYGSGASYEIDTPPEDMVEWARGVRNALAATPIVSAASVKRDTPRGEETLSEYTELFRSLVRHATTNPRVHTNGVHDVFARAGSVLALGFNRSAAILTPDFDAAAEGTLRRTGASRLEATYSTNAFFSMEKDIVRAADAALGDLYEDTLYAAIDRGQSEVARVADRTPSILTLSKFFENAIAAKHGVPSDFRDPTPERIKTVMDAIGKEFSGLVTKTTIGEIREAAGGTGKFPGYNPTDSVLVNTYITEHLRSGSGDYSGATRGSVPATTSTSWTYRFVRVLISSSGVTPKWRFVNSDEARAIEAKMQQKIVETRTATQTAPHTGDAPAAPSAASKLGFYGIYQRASGKFHVVDVSLRKKAWGRVCEFFQVPELIRYTLLLEPDATVATVVDSAETAEFYTARSRDHSVTQDAVDEYVSNIRGLGATTPERRRELYAFGLLRKAVLCNFIRGRLEAMNLIVSV